MGLSPLTAFASAVPVGVFCSGTEAEQIISPKRKNSATAVTPSQPLSIAGWGAAGYAVAAAHFPVIPQDTRMLQASRQHNSTPEQEYISTSTMQNTREIGGEFSPEFSPEHAGSFAPLITLRASCVRFQQFRENTF